MTNRRHWLAAALPLALIAGALGYPAQASATPTTAYTADLGVSSATSMVRAQGKLFVASGNSVLVRNLVGAPLAQIGGEFGVSELLVSPDGSKVYAADRNGSAISLIDAATNTEQAHWSVDGCPTHLALSSGRVFYSYGCDQFAAGIASVDALSGGAPVSSGLPATDLAPSELAGTATRVLALLSQSPTRLTSYSVTGATLTATASTADLQDYSSSLALRADGSKVALTRYSPPEVDEFDTSSLTETGTVPMAGSPSAVAYDSSAGRLVAGYAQRDYTQGNLQTFSVGTGQSLVLSQAKWVSDYWLPGVLPGTLSFGPDNTGHQDALVYGLATSGNGDPVHLVVGPAGPLSVAHMTLGLSSPVAYGRPLSVSVTFPGHANTALTLKVLPNSGSPIYVPVRTNQWGVATASIKVNFTGRVYAYYGGDLLTRHEAPSASAIHSFTVPTRTTVSMLGAYKRSGGVLYFRPGVDVQFHVVAGPPHVRPVTVVLQYFVDGKWYSHPGVHFTTNEWGVTDLYFTGGSHNRLYRTVISTPTSVFNTGSSATSMTFMIG